MLGIVYLVLCFALGYVICSFVFPGLSEFMRTNFKGKELNISGYFVMFPAWFVTGTLVMTWGCYIMACIFSNTTYALLYADEFMMIIAIPVIAAGLFFLLRKRGRILKGELKKITTSEQVLLAAVLILFALLMHMSFRVSHGQLYTGLTVFSDFTPHLAMIRSFSLGNNFPTRYPVSGGSDVKYHFMFQFLVGNLEFLGLRIDHAFNLPSLLSVVCMFMLLYAFTCKVSGKKSTGIIACSLLAFRSSASLFVFLAGVDPEQGIWRALSGNFNFLGSTPNEDWGLWNLNVYCNQRHLAFAACGMLLVIMMFMPKLYGAFDDIEDAGGNIKAYFQASLINREGWTIGDLKLAIGSGLLLGGLGFWNGAVLIATVTVLFFMAVISRERLDYLIMAALAGILSIVQTSVFMDGNAFKFAYNYGFLAEKKTLFGSIMYLNRMLGILPILLLIVFMISKGARRYSMIAFSMPIIFAFTVQMTPDIAVNHKYIMLSVMLLDIYAAIFISVLFNNKKYCIKVFAGFLLLCLTSSGIYDTYILMKRNNPRYSMVTNLDGEMTKWIAANTTSQDLFLTGNYYLSNSAEAGEFILSGAISYLQWQYFGWSAGYDTNERDYTVKRIYGCRDKDELIELVEDKNINYIVIGAWNRDSEDYKLNEELFDETFDVVFRQGTGHYETKIYKVG